MRPMLGKVIRMDSMPLDQTYYTEEGYLVDHPILTSTGIFEYHNEDGSIRRELRLPEEVFDPESLASYKGRPIIITHDAGLITKDNVAENEIGTILSEGYRDGDDVRAEIIIHDTDEMKDWGLKELSLGYNLDLDETPGVYEGEPYDAIQRNIRINHLALVQEARAGDQARLNIDSRDSDNLLKGGKLMKKTKKTTRTDSVLSPEELKKAVEEYKERRAKKDGDDDKKPTPPAKEDKTVGVAGLDSEDLEKQKELVKDRRDRRDEAGDPKDKKEAMEVIANQDEDIDILFDIIDSLLAKVDYDSDDDDEFAKDCGKRKDDDDDDEFAKDCGKRKDDDDDDFDEDDDDLEEDDDDDDLNEDHFGKECDTDGDDDDLEEDDDDDDFDEDDDDDDIPSRDENDDDDDDDIPSTNKMNSDSVDRIVRERMKIRDAAKALHMDSMDKVAPLKAKKRIIRKARPGIRLDGKSAAYVNSMFDCVCDDIKMASKKDTSYQRRQMFNKDSADNRRKDPTESARNKMIKNLQNGKRRTK